MDTTSISKRNTVNHWLVTPHDFKPMPEEVFEALCMFCGGRRYSSPHYDHVGTWSKSRLLANTTGLDGPQCETKP